ncbi:hypothetical protein D915_007024 [Fasciola hepatica]|uniref:FZ domain-containing protein n=1 Tax=Fasciola hepatica TaxID=6192 RepID=A0A4E0R2D8_FASHE|nr:hypothetical protein D915_007024 [Fasciola hepatica]
MRHSMKNSNWPAHEQNDDATYRRFGQKHTTWNLLLWFSILLTTVSFATMAGASKAQATQYESVGIWTARRNSVSDHKTAPVTTPTTRTITTVAFASSSASVNAFPSSAKNNTTKKSSDPLSIGYWLNLGIPYYKCPSPYEADRCKNLPSTRSVPENSAIWKPDYALLMERITCVIQKLNCPTDNRSFQLHDIPCQSACLSVVNACQRQMPYTGCQSSAYSSSTRNSLWPITSGSYLNQIGASETSTYLYPYGSNVFYPPYARYPGGHGSHLARRRSGREPYTNRFAHTRRYPYTTEPALSAPLHEQQAQGQQWEQIRIRRNTLRTNQDYLVGGSSNNPMGTNSLTETDCYLLPSGGCDKMSTQLVETDQHTSASIEHNVRINPGCPSDLAAICNAMFPREYTRQQWVKGDFTVAAVIRIAQTLWWFGPNNRFQPFFRFHVTETLESDIHPYDDKMILTYSWPSRCICPNEITAEKYYLMLTHSVKSRQTLNITSSTVFLSRVKRYTRRLSCWKGSCIRRGHRNRRRRYPSGIWRWNP